jgi:antitoxin VapB
MRFFGSMLLLPALALASEPVTNAELRSEIDVKLGRVQQFLKAQKLGGVLLTAVANFSWVTAGIADNHIVITSEAGTSSLLIMDDGKKYVVTSNSEMARLLAEDLNGLGYEPREYKWYEDKIVPDRKLALIREIAHGRPIGTDLPYADLRTVGDQFAPLRYPLTDSEAKKYRWLGRNATEAVASVARRIQPGVSEFEMETMASDELMRRGIRPTVLLMGVDDRIFNFKHTTPSAAKLRQYAFVNVCARRWGLVVSTGRFVYFGAPPESLRQRVHASAQVSANLLAHTRPGALAGDLFELARRSYAELGFPGEEQKHHMGGAIGYAEREWVAVPGSRETVREDQAFAWNPFVAGTLSFDTFLVHKDSAENLDLIDDWPVITVQSAGQTFRLPDILVR